MAVTWRPSYEGTVRGFSPLPITTTCANAKRWTTSKCTSPPPSTGPTCRTNPLHCIQLQLWRNAPLNLLMSTSTCYPKPRSLCRPFWSISLTGTLHERDVQELLEKCHPLGMFDSIATLAVAQNMRELYRLVLVDTPLAPYFSECITSEDLDDMNIEIMRNTLYKAYLEDFYRFCKKLGGATAEIMSDLLAFEADRRAVNITINSIGTELTRDDRRNLYSNFGLLYPYGHEELALCEDIDQVRGAMEKYPPYQSIFSKLSYGESQMLDKAFYEEEVKRLCLAFEQQFHYGVFFAYMRLREQEIRNLMWISECVAQNQKSRVHDSVVFIF
ncbi:V-type proton ATPase subunit d1-like isoform X2 [Andrographis paniculata]|uniref:V-type proton ATPase subunit d1-like isoform X2 n=1 Tax=Andrographis paniculata TaxID=175694 RepID=UPI0021E983CA|nr:V-type proton ATPase subunit d1-like isoform X2 [Andrographis paniculata]